MYWVRAIFLLLLCYDRTFALSPRCGKTVSDILKVFTLVPSQSRTDDLKNIVTLYKNDDRFASWIASSKIRLAKSDPFSKILWRYQQEQQSFEAPPVCRYSLSGPQTANGCNLSRGSAKLRNLIRGQIDTQREVDVEANLAEVSVGSYERNVWELRRGDTVVFSHKEFKLGEFLGAGNAVHAFALADNPKVAIKIPILSLLPQANIGLIPSTPAKRVEAARKFLAALCIDSFLEGDHLHKRIIEAGGDFEYVLQERVFGNEDAHSFSLKLLTREFPIFKQRVKFSYPRDDQDDEALPAEELAVIRSYRELNRVRVSEGDPQYRFAWLGLAEKRGLKEEAKKIAKLLKISPKLLPGLFPTGAWTPSTSEMQFLLPDPLARQLVWDEVDEEWYQVDFESEHSVMRFLFLSSGSY